MASQITSFMLVYSTVYSDADQRKHQNSASLGFVWGIHRDRWFVYPIWVISSQLMTLLPKGSRTISLSFPMKMASSTQLWYIRASAGRYVFQWDRLLDEGLAFVQARVPSCPDDVTLRSCVWEFQIWRRICKQIDPHGFQRRQMRFWWMWSIISRKYFMIYPVRLFSTANF